MPSFLALDADAAGLVLASADARGRLTRVVADPSAPPLTTATAADVGAKVRGLMSANGVRATPAVVCVGRDKVVWKEVGHPPAAAADEPAVVRFQAAKELAEPPDDAVMDYAPRASAPTGERRAVALFVKRDVVAAARAVCDAAGLKLAAVCPRPFGVPGLIGEADGGVGVLSLWAGGGEFVVATGAEVGFARPVSAAAAADEAVLAAEVKRNLAVAAGGDGPPRELRVVADDPGLADRLAAVLPVPVAAADPLADIAADLPAGFAGRAAGLAGLLAVAAAGRLPINFAAPRQPKPAVDPNRVRVLAGALGGVLLLGGGAVVGMLEVDKASRAVAAAARAQAEVDAELAAVELDAKRLAAAEAFVGRGVVWLDELYDLTARFPDRTKLKLVEFDAAPAAAPPPTRRPGGPAPAKSDKPPAVGELRLVLAADDPAAVDRLVDATARDRYYPAIGRAAGGLTSAGATTQQVTVTAQVAHRPPADYKRKVVPPPPARPDDSGEGPP